MKTFFLFIYSIAATGIFAQKNLYSFEDVVYGLTTIVNTFPNQYEKEQGTGFFFHEYKADSLLKYNNPIDSSLKRIWLITNSHVLFGDDFQKHPQTPLALQFYLRRKNPTLPPTWDTVTIVQKDFLRLVKSHPKADISAIDITEFLKPVLKKDSSYIYNAISKMNFPGEKHGINENNEYELEVGQEILSIGYPKEFYDTYNLYPTVKSGMIASKWKANYNGNPIFLIDAKLFPGSSGSIIITKSHTYAMPFGDIDFFVFLGIYSGEYLHSEKVNIDDLTIIKNISYNTGIVWYYDLLDGLIK